MDRLTDLLRPASIEDCILDHVVSRDDAGLEECERDFLVGSLATH